MLLLVIKLVNFPDLELIGTSVDHESDPRVRRNRNVNAVTAMKRRVFVDVRIDATPGQQFCRHRADYRAAFRVVLVDDLVHQRYGDIGQSIPAGFFANLTVWPARTVSENQHYGLGLPMHLVLVLSILILVPGRLILLQNSVAKCRRIKASKFAEGNANIHCDTSFSCQFNRRRLYHSGMTGQASENIVAATWTKPLSPPEKLPTAADIVIIGGGIVGVSTAWFLAKQGISVVLCEKGHVAGEQSGRNWGWVRVQGRDTREIPMMLESQRIWEGLAEEIGEDVGFTRGGCFFTANSSKELQSFEKWVDIARDYDIGTRLINGTELKKYVPGSAVDWAGAMFTETDGRAEPHKATPAIARAAERSGATILSSCAVRGVETAAGSVSSVVTEHGTIKTSTVLCAAGAWTSMFCRSLGIDVPQLRVRGTVARTAPCENVLNGNIFDHRLGIRRREDGGYTVAHGSVLEHPVTPASFRYFFKFLPALLQELKLVNLSFGREFVDEWTTPKVWALDQPSPFEKTRVLNPSPTPSVLKGIRRNLDSMFPQLADTPIVESWAGMIESSPDVVPVIDAVDRMRGFHVATGFSGHGFGIGPGAGKAIAGMLTGKETGIDISALRLSRFFDGSPIRPESSI